MSDCEKDSLFFQDMLYFTHKEKGLSYKKIKLFLKDYTFSEILS
jgi:hypothetical protein